MFAIRFQSLEHFVNQTTMMTALMQHGLRFGREDPSEIDDCRGKSKYLGAVGGALYSSRFQSASLYLSRQSSHLPLAIEYTLETSIDLGQIGRGSVAQMS